MKEILQRLCQILDEDVSEGFDNLSRAEETGENKEYHFWSGYYHHAKKFKEAVVKEISKLDP